MNTDSYIDKWNMINIKTDNDFDDIDIDINEEEKSNTEPYDYNYNHQYSNIPPINWCDRILYYLIGYEDE